MTPQQSLNPGSLFGPQDLNLTLDNSSNTQNAETFGIAITAPTLSSGQSGANSSSSVTPQQSFNQTPLLEPQADTSLSMITTPMTALSLVAPSYNDYVGSGSMQYGPVNESWYNQNVVQPSVEAMGTLATDSI